MQPAVVEVAVGQQAQCAAIAPTGCHHDHDALVVTLHNSAKAHPELLLAVLIKRRGLLQLQGNGNKMDLHRLQSRHLGSIAGALHLLMTW